MRREAILEAANRLFRHYGPFKTTVADIAREAGVGVGTLYLEFKSKDAILAALSRKRHEDVLEAVERAWGDGNPAARCLEHALAARFEAFVVCAGEGMHSIDLVAARCAPIEESQREFRAAEHALFARFLSHAMETGALQVHDPVEDARVLLIAYRAFEPPHLFRGKQDELRRDLERLHRIVLEGLLPR